MTSAVTSNSTPGGTESPATLALSVAAFFMFSYALCVAGALILPPGGVVHRLLLIVPGFAWNAAGIVQGFASAVGGGIYVGVVYGLIHRAIAKRTR